MPWVVLLEVIYNLVVIRQGLSGEREHLAGDLKRPCWIFISIWMYPSQCSCRAVQNPSWRTHHISEYVQMLRHGFFTNVATK